MMTEEQITAAEQAHDRELALFAEEAWMREWDSQVEAAANVFEPPC